MVKRKKKREKFLRSRNNGGGFPESIFQGWEARSVRQVAAWRIILGHVFIKTSRRGRDLGDTGRKGWKDERRTGTRIGVEHTIVFRHTFSPVLSKTMHALPLTISIALCWTAIVFLFLLVGMSLRSLSKSPSWRLVFELKWKFTVWTDVESLFPRRNFSSTLFRCPEIRAGKIKTTCPPGGDVLFLLGEASVHRGTSYGIYIEEVSEISLN